MTTDQALAVVATLLKAASAEAERLARRVKTNAEQPARASSAGQIPMPVASTAVEEMIALRVARGQVEALRAVEVGIMRADRDGA